MHCAILGTAGHIDHGKTALVAALTGVDTDRLKEEKERGITIDLGFAELQGEGVRLGVVDVPGHEGFVRNMLAGATGMDLALLVVAADEGVMPQTREHLAILSLLGVSRLLVAVTKIDLVEADWVDLVEDEVREALADAGYDDVPFARVSARTGEGVEALRERLLALAARSVRTAADDLLALPVDRVFTVRGTGTVVTGTLLSGRVAVGDRVRLLPSGLDARVRGVQVHGADTDAAGPGTRTAVALTGDGIDRHAVERGELLVSDSAWAASHMVTAELRVLPDTGWAVRHNQRVRVHLGTAEVMARCVVPGVDELAPGETGWVQLRLEAPVATRAGVRGVVRSYSPITTIGGIRVVEPAAPKRGRSAHELEGAFRAVLDGDVESAVAAVVSLAGAAGVPVADLPVRVGWSPDAVRGAVTALEARGGGTTAGGRAVGPRVVEALTRDLLDALDGAHHREPWRPGLPVEALRARAPAGGADGLVDMALRRAEVAGQLEVRAGVVRRPGFEVRLDPARTRLRSDLLQRFEAAGLAPPFVAELPDDLRADPAFDAILQGLVDDGQLVVLDHELHLSARVGAEATEAVVTALGGRQDLGPADFRDVLPVTRRHLLPLLAWLDRCGVTRRTGEGRAVRTRDGTREPAGDPG